MAPDQKIFKFKGVLERFGGKGGWYFIRFPFSVHELFGTRGTIRMKGMLNDTPIERALMPDGQGGHFIAISAGMRRTVGLRLGNEVQVRLQLHDDPDRVEVPEELAEALELDPEAKAVYEGLTPGVRRSMVLWISSGKRPETRAQRSVEMLRRLQTGFFTKRKAG